MSVRVWLAAVSALGWLGLSAAPAEAKILLITHGDTVSEYGKPKVNMPGLPTDMVVGYKYSYGGVFWIDAWTWGGEYCIYSPSQKAFDPLQRSQAAALLGVPEADIPPPFFYRYPHVPFFLAIAAIVFVPLKIYGSISDAKEAKRAAELLSEPHYQTALATAVAMPASDLEARKAALEVALKQLHEAGVTEADGRANLLMLVRRYDEAQAAATPPATA